MYIIRFTAIYYLLRYLDPLNDSVIITNFNYFLYYISILHTIYSFFLNLTRPSEIMAIGINVYYIMFSFINKLYILSK